MSSKRSKRLFMIMLMVMGVGLTVSLVLFALNKNINLYYTPSQLDKTHLKREQIIRIGGVVKKGSVVRNSHDLKLQFVITDFSAEIPIIYQGVLPSLFREGQGVVVAGKFNSTGEFMAQQVLAKHDEKYMPPKITGYQQT